MLTRKAPQCFDLAATYELALASRAQILQRQMVTATLPHKLSVLVFLQNQAGEHLLIERVKAPNAGLWSPIGGKIETSLGESPHECAARETREEIGLNFSTDEFHLFAMIAERAYEGGAHWLMFLFTCQKRVADLPVTIDEGRFGFFSRNEIDALPLPETDRTGLWPIYDRHRNGFVALRADCTPGRPLQIIVEETLPGPPTVTGRVGL